MAIIVVRRSELNPEQLAAVSNRLAAPEHRNDRGACTSWNQEAGIYVALSSDSSEPVGVLFAGGPPSQISAAWWVDLKFRGQGLGSAMIDAFASYLKAAGVTGVGRIPIDTFAGKYHEASCSLANRFKEHFRVAGG